MIPISIGTYLLSASIKFIALKRNYENLRCLILSSLQLSFKKNQTEAILSFPQLIGLIGLFVGIIELMLQKYIDSLSVLSVSFLEAAVF